MFVVGKEDKTGSQSARISQSVNLENKPGAKLGITVTVKDHKKKGADGMPKTIGHCLKGGPKNSHVL